MNSKDKDYLNQIEEIMEHKRNKNPVYQEYNKLFAEMFPVKQFNDVFNLGMAYMLSCIKNDMSEFLCSDRNEYVDLYIKEIKNNNEVMCKYLTAFIK